MRSDIMASYKEIVTKAIIGKGKKYFKNEYSLDVENVPSTILGCWVINHKFNGYKTGDRIGVDGSFDVNIWYSYENDSKTTVVNKKKPPSPSTAILPNGTVPVYKYSKPADIHGINLPEPVRRLLMSCCGFTRTRTSIKWLTATRNNLYTTKAVLPFCISMAICLVLFKLY